MEGTGHIAESRPTSRLPALAIALLLAAFLLAPAPFGKPAAAAPKKVLTVATNGSVDSLSPFLAQRVLPTEVHRLVYDFLTNYDPKDDHAVPAMATSWSPSPDKLTWTYTIRSGMKWSDGVPVTARDIAWTYNLMMTNKDAATANGNFVANFKSVTAPDDSTLVVVLGKPQATMLALDIPVVPQHVWESHVSDIGTFNNDATFPIVGDGPFILSAYRKDQYIQLDANPGYWRGRPKFDQLIFKHYANQDAEVQALKKGEVDFAGGLTPAQFNSLKGAANITLNNGDGKRFYALAMNPGPTTTNGKPFGDGNPALKDPLVRQAIMEAIDKPTLVNKTLGGFGVVGQGYIPPIFSTYTWSPPATETVGSDPAKANQLLDQAGYRKGSDGRRTTPDGKPFTLRLYGETQRAEDAQNATFVKEWLDAIGINVSASIVDQATVGDNETAGNYDLAFDSWLVNPDPDFVLSIQTCGARPATAGGSFPGDNFVCDPTYDQLYAAQISEYDAAARAGLIKKMEAQLFTDRYVNVLYYPNTLEAYRNDVIGSMQMQPQPNGIYDGQDGYWSWWSATPGAAASSSSHVGAWAVVAGVAVVAVVLAAVVLLVVRRRSTAQERE
ncbi:MAG: peptide/nickel transport system substrate-binding protein [Actinomycetota bacterium]|nr:peptide/nickel transport system substrate-binding protein [Actinomycetota bacterium]